MFVISKNAKFCLSAEACRVYERLSGSPIAPDGTLKTTGRVKRKRGWKTQTIIQHVLRHDPYLIAIVNASNTTDFAVSDNGSKLELVNMDHETSFIVKTYQGESPFDSYTVAFNTWKAIRDKEPTAQLVLLKQTRTYQDYPQ